MYTCMFGPSQVTAAIVTCGGLCPGLNDVVAGIVNKLTDYGVPEGRILGIKYGFRWAFLSCVGQCCAVLCRAGLDRWRGRGGLYVVLGRCVGPGEAAGTPCTPCYVRGP